MAVLLLNNFNGSDGATTFVDSVSGITWTRLNSVGELDTAQAAFGVSSVLCRGGTPIAPLRATGFSSPHAGSWTYQGRVRFAGTSTAYVSLQRTSSSPEDQIYLNIDAQFDAFNVFGVANGTNFIDSGNTVTINVNTWYHFAVVRDVVAGTYAFYFAGNRIHLATTATNPGLFDAFVVQGGSGGDIWFDAVLLTNVVEFSGATYTVPAMEPGGSGNAAPLPHLGLLLQLTTTLSAAPGSLAVAGTNAALKYTRIFSAEAGSVAVTGTTAELKFTDIFPVDSGSVAIAGTTATLEHRRFIAAGGGSVAITGTAANFITGSAGSGASASLPSLSTLFQQTGTFNLVTGTGNVTVTGMAANFLFSHFLSAASGSWAITGAQASLLFGHILTAGAGSVAITGTAVTLSVSSTGVKAPAPLPHLSLLMERTNIVEALTGNLTITGAAAGLISARKVVSGAGSAAITGTDATLNKGFTLSVAPGSVIITGDDSASFIDYIQGAESGTTALAGADVNLLYSQQPALVAGSGSIAISEAIAGLLYGAVFLAEEGEVLVTGSVSDLRATRLLSAESGSIAAVGVPSFGGYGRFITLDSGVISLTAPEAVVSKSGTATLVAEAVTIALSGQDALLLAPRGFGLLAGTGSIVITGTAIFLSKSLGLFADQAQILIAGQPATLTKSSAPPPFWLREPAVEQSFWIREAVLAEV